MDTINFGSTTVQIHPGQLEHRPLHPIGDEKYPLSRSYLGADNRVHVLCLSDPSTPLTEVAYRVEKPERHLALCCHRPSDSCNCLTEGMIETLTFNPITGEWE